MRILALLSAFVAFGCARPNKFGYGVVESSVEVEGGCLYHIRFEAVRNPGVFTSKSGKYYTHDQFIMPCDCFMVGDTVRLVKTYTPTDTSNHE